MTELMTGSRSLVARARQTLFALGALVITGCQSGGHVAQGSESTPGRPADEEVHVRPAFRESEQRYKAMADAGDPKGIYYMAVAYAARHMKDPGMDATNVKRMYEHTVSAGSNDARVALANMLICGSTGTLWTVACLPNLGLPQSERDPVRGLELLNQAAATSCSFTEPLIGYGRCRERERSIPVMLAVLYRDGEGGLPKDPAQEAHWRQREKTCRPEIDRIKRQQGC